MKRFSLTIPATSEVLMIPRLLMTGIAATYDVDVEHLEDMKLLITECCNLSFLSDADEISVVVLADENRASVSVSPVNQGLLDDEEQALSMMILSSLADEVHCEEGVLRITLSMR